MQKIIKQNLIYIYELFSECRKCWISKEVESQGYPY